jgi:hypothetical protein
LNENYYLKVKRCFGKAKRSEKKIEMKSPIKTIQFKRFSYSKIIDWREGFTEKHTIEINLIDLGISINLRFVQ